MKSLIILRGLVEREKKEWVRSEGLGCFFISLDQLRSPFYRPEQLRDKCVLTRSRDDSVYKVFLEALIGRMGTGNLIVIDPGTESTSTIEELAVIFGYTVFNKYFKTPWNFDKKYRSYLNNLYKFPSQEQILKEIDRHRKWEGNNIVECFAEVEQYWKKKETLINLEDTEQVLHISDVHSNHSLVSSVLRDYEDKVSLVVFLGDYIDGNEKGGSRRMIDQILTYEGNEKFLCLCGNHELRLRKWLGYNWMRQKERKVAAQILKESLPEDFEKRTVEEFTDLQDDDFEGMLVAMNKTLKTHGTYQRGKETIICSHTGLGSVNHINPLFIGNLIYSNKNPDKVDSEFSRNCKRTEVYSIHGHCKYPSGLCFEKYENVINIDTENEDMINYFIERGKIWTLKK